MSNAILTIERFAQKIKIGFGEDACWMWDSATDKDGYGIFGIDGKDLKAHRYSYSACVGVIPDGLCICHQCDNPTCVNPKHLFLGTNKQNTQDRHNKNRDAKGITSGAYTHPEARRIGEDNGNAKLSTDIVVAIRSEYKPHSKDCDQKQLAKKYNISKEQVYRIIHKQNWRHV
jgi:hypothetical protein